MRKILLNVVCGDERDVIEFEVNIDISEENLEKECEEQFFEWMGSMIDSGYGIKSNTIIEEG